MKIQALLLAFMFSTGLLNAAEPLRLVERARKAPSPPWPAGDERGMANAIGPETFARCAWHIARRGAKSCSSISFRSRRIFPSLATSRRI